ncbi:MAG TPA: hypothetical protein VIV60_33810, partial [Polyangiaceae bacterium]
MLVTALFLAAVIPDGLLVVETGSPDSFCPSLDQTAQAIHARMGTIKSEQKGWLARYTLGHAPGSEEGDFIRLQLYDPQRQLRLMRDLPIKGASCATMAQSIAIVLGVFFTNLSDVAVIGDAAPSNADSEAPDAGSLETGVVARCDNEPKLVARTHESRSTTLVSPSPPPEEPTLGHQLSASFHVPFTSTSRELAV